MKAPDAPASGAFRYLDAASDSGRYVGALPERHLGDTPS